MLSTLSAHDFGYISTLEFVERQELTFASLTKLGKLRGHFFNWYDTRTLEPLLPQYISTVDSGNLAGHLIALKQAFIEMPEVRLLDQRVIDGLTDTILAISEEAGRLGTVRQRTEVVTVRHLRDEIEACKELLASDSNRSPWSWFLLFNSLEKHGAEIADIVDALSLEHGSESFQDLRWWVGALRQQVRSYRRDVMTLTPWGQLSLSPIEAAIEGLDEETKAHWRDVAGLLDAVPTLLEIPELADQALPTLAALQARLAESATAGGHESQSASGAISRLSIAIEIASDAANDLLSRLSRLAQKCEQIVEEMDFRFLLDPERKVFTIGYNVGDLRPDNSFYDLLASEARLASFVAIAKDDVPQEHWFRMGRQLTSVNGGRALISWTGTMFEYLMPLLVMRNYEGTLLNETYRSVVARQIEYGRERGVPWGISESAYNVRDLQLNYQYGPFGVPGLGLKRGLIEDLVIAPYATMLAAMISPNAAMENLRALEREGALGSLWFLRVNRLHDGAPTAGSKTRHHSRLHDSPPGHESGRADQYALQRSHGESLSCRSGGAGHRTAAAGANPGGRARGASSGRRSADGSGHAIVARHDHPRLQHAGSGNTAHAAAFEWHLQRHDHHCRSRLFRMWPKRCHSLARRRDQR